MDAVMEATKELDAELHDNVRWDIGVMNADAVQAAGDATDDSWLPDWFCKQNGLLDDEEERLSRQYKVRMAQIDARRMAIRIRWGERCQAEIAMQMQAAGGKRKSIDGEYGRYGYRKRGGRLTAEVVDKDAAIASVMTECPAALKQELLKSVLLDHIKKTGKPINGVEVVETPEQQVTFAGKVVFANSEGETNE
jgi:hypothetical protein